MNNKSLLQTLPLSLYIHIPWCVRKCPYCDFNSHEAGDNIDEPAYIAALMADLDSELENNQHRELQSIFFGGGTPSLFSAESIHKIIENITSKTTLTRDMEITLEANPGTFEQRRFTDYRSAGINRLSIGIQSFNDEKLESLGRIHNRNEAIKAIEMAYAAGFENINLDLMFGLPKQRINEALVDIELACTFQPTHISHYQLTIEPNTFFYKHTPVLPATDDIWEMQQLCHDTLNEHGYIHYEVSAFSQVGKQCRHNLNYWKFGDYIGIGAGAHGKITNINNQSIQRRWKHRQPAAYIKHAMLGNPCSGTNVLEQADILFEFLLNSLRLRDGFSYELFEQRCGINRHRLLEACNHIDPDLLVITDAGLNTSQRGFDFLNDVLGKLLESSKQVEF